MEFSSRQLRAFLLVARHRSFSRAAEALYITPSGLSVLIRELETHLGFRLFDRTTRHVALTNAGNELLGATRDSLAKLDAATARIGRSLSHAEQSLSLGAAPLIAANILLPAIKEFRIHQPNLRVQLFDERAPAILQMIRARKLDMGVGIYARSPGIRRTPFLRFPLVVIRPDKGLVSAARSSTAWSALKGEKVISLQSTSPIQQVIKKYLARAGLSGFTNTSINLLDTQIAMVEADEGIAIIPSYGLAASRNRKVVMSRLVNPVAEVEFHLISNRAKKLPPEADEFTKFLKHYVAEWAGRYVVV